MTIEIVSQNPTDKIYYWIKNEYDDRKDKDWILYTSPITIDMTSEILAKIKNESQESNVVSATFFKKPNNYTIEIKSTYNPQYHAGGPEGLLDGINGTTNWRKGDWQGYQSQDFEAVVDLKEEKEISSFNANFLQDQRSWILMPTKVEYYVSKDKVNFTLVGTVNNMLDPKVEENTIRDFTYTTEKVINSQYVKVKAYNYGKLPEWHQGYPFNGDAFIFIDEMVFGDKDNPFVKRVALISCGNGPIFDIKAINFNLDNDVFSTTSIESLIKMTEILKQYSSMKIEIQQMTKSKIS